MASKLVGLSLRGSSARGREALQGMDLSGVRIALDMDGHVCSSMNMLWLRGLRVRGRQVCMCSGCFSIL